MVKRIFLYTYQQAKRLVVIVVGFTVLIVGVAMIVLPGPAVLIIPIGLTLLATEYVWAKKLLTKFKATADQITNSHKIREIRAFFSRILSKVRSSAPGQ